MAALDAADTASRPEAGVELNRRFNELVAFYLEHLAHEEVTIRARHLGALLRRRAGRSEAR